VTLYFYTRREQLFGVDTPVRVAAAVVMVVLGWALARDLGRFTAPALFRRMDPATAGTIGFLIRLVFLVIAALFSLHAAGLKPETLAVGGAITAVVFGLAAQQTLGNLIAGMVLISARPFKVGDRVRLQAGGLAGQIEGVVGSLGLLYTTFARGQDSIMVPNNVVLTAAVVPLREPAAVDLRARLRPDVKPSDLQSLLEDSVQTPVRSEPHISLEEVDRDEVIVRIAATPLAESDGPRLADEVLSAIAVMTREDGDEHDEHDDALAGGDAGRDERDPRRRTNVTQEYGGGTEPNEI
jgi:small-conductance mechanosensitive channel